MSNYLVYMYKHDEDNYDETLLYGVCESLEDAMEEASYMHEVNLEEDYDDEPTDTYETDHSLSAEFGERYAQLTCVLEIPDNDVTLLTIWQDYCSLGEPRITALGFDDVDSARNAMRDAYEEKMKKANVAEWGTFDKEYSSIEEDMAHCGIQTWDYQLDMVVLHEGNRYGIDVPVIQSF